MKHNPSQPVYQDTPELEKARKAFFNHEYQKSLRMFERAAKRQPHNIMALTDAARAFGQRYEIEKAAQYVERMLILGKRNPQVRILAGQTLRMIHRADEAIPHFKAATVIGKTNPDVHIEYAVLLERRGDLSEALDQTERYLSYEQENLEATLLKARIIRRMGRECDAKDIYQSISENSRCSHFTRAQALNEWANLEDSQGDHDGAWEKLRLSKSLISELPESKQASARSVSERAALHHLTDSITREHFTKWASREATIDQRSLLLTGCPRSGTTLIEKILDAHPEIISADELGAFSNFILPGLVNGKRDTQGFFNADTLDRLPPVRAKREEKRYFRYLQDALNEKIGNRILVDKNPSVTFTIPVHQYVWPNNKILYALRDPRDVALSCFFRWLPINSMSVRFHSLEDTCKRTAEELECWLRLREILPEDSWHETRYENTIADYTNESSQILKWMNLGWHDSMTNYRTHMAKRGVNSPTYEAVTQPIYKKAQGRWENYQQHFEPVIEQLTNVIDAYGYR
ncbi:MAG: tetratricopeptide repeat-containing sulfotransferase family protein [Akkermansiaceae bacterium]